MLKNDMKEANGFALFTVLFKPHIPNQAIPLNNGLGLKKL